MTPDDIINANALALIIAVYTVDTPFNQKISHEATLFLKTHKAAKDIYSNNEVFVKAYNSIQETDFTVEQLEKYLVLI